MRAQPCPEKKGRPWPSITWWSLRHPECFVDTAPSLSVCVSTTTLCTVTRQVKSTHRGRIRACSKRWLRPFYSNEHLTAPIFPSILFTVLIPVPSCLGSPRSSVNTDSPCHAWPIPPRAIGAPRAPRRRTKTLPSSMERAMLCADGC